MPFTKEILSMFEFKHLFHFDEYPLSQERSVPTEQPTLSMHRNLLIESHRKASVALYTHLSPVHTEKTVNH